MADIGQIAFELFKQDDGKWDMRRKPLDDVVDGDIVVTLVVERPVDATVYREAD